MYGRLEKADDRWRLRFTRRLAHPPEKVWRALTEDEHLAAWFPSTVEGERAAGATLRFSFGDEADGLTIEGGMTACDRPRLLEFRWGDEMLRFELEPDGDGTVLTFTDTFDELGKAARDAAGWHACLTLLGHRLAGDEPPVPSEQLWAEAHPWYVREFGPEAATLGPPGQDAGA